MTFLQKIVVAMTIFSSSAFAEPMRVMGIDSVHTNLGWQIVNDTVMGGRSKSRFDTENGQLFFSGVINTNGGGFASLRSDRQDWDLSMFSVIRLKVLGDGRTYKFRLFADNDRASYQREFVTTADKWQVVELPIDKFYASWRGRPLDRPPLAASEIAGIGLILADGKDGSFNLTVDWIELH
jgi:NADH dehydrogenase [ubiquinone] 1 alpha subcomplex assembly factor 1